MVTDVQTNAAIALLRQPQTIRDRCREILALGLRGDLAHFRVDATRIEPTADFVLGVIKENYPDITKIPYHSRWRHFGVGGIARVAAWHDQNQGLDKLEQLRREIELVITSVLLDAGSGPHWQYEEKGTGKKFSRSEGLGVASWHMFMRGGFSGNAQGSQQANSGGLEGVSAKAIADFFQVSKTNPLVGIEGRAQLMQNLGRVISKDARFSIAGHKRLGHLADLLLKKVDNRKLRAAQVLECVLDTLSPIWPGRITLGDQNMGDVWKHSMIVRADATDNLLPFHKLSQWLTYSLLEPLEWYGVSITDLNELTGLAEYRNGGLLIDLNVLVPREPSRLAKPIEPAEEFVVEWRALTVALLDELVAKIRPKLGLDASSFPLAKLLEGGTWSAGRKIAAQLRPGGGPPLQIISDGTVF